MFLARSRETIGNPWERLVTEWTETQHFVFVTFLLLHLAHSLDTHHHYSEVKNMKNHNMASLNVHMYTVFEVKTKVSKLCVFWLCDAVALSEFQFIVLKV